MTYKLLWFLLPFCFAFMCTEQHDPRGHWKQIREESDSANQAKAVLNADGSLPSTGDKASDLLANADPIDIKYNTLCSSCHGADGKANGPAALALNPRPRNLTDLAWQKSVDDARIYKVIKEGGTSVGLSATMAAWGAVLSEDELNGLVKKVRAFAAAK